MFDGTKENLGPIGEKEKHTLDLTISANHSSNLIIYDIFSGSECRETPVFQRYKEYLQSPFTYYGVDIHSDETNVVENGNKIIGVCQNLLTHPDIDMETASIDIFHAHKPLIYGSASRTHANLDKIYDPANLVEEAERTLKPKGRFVLSLDAYFLNSQFMDDDPQINFERLLQALTDNFNLVSAAFEPSNSYGKDIKTYFPDIQPDLKLANDTFTIFETVSVLFICEKK